MPKERFRVNGEVGTHPRADRPRLAPIRRRSEAAFIAFGIRPGQMVVDEGNRVSAVEVSRTDPPRQSTPQTPLFSPSLLSSTSQEPNPLVHETQLAFRLLAVRLGLTRF